MISLLLAACVWNQPSEEELAVMALEYFATEGEETLEIKNKHSENNLTKFLSVDEIEALKKTITPTAARASTSGESWGMGTPQEFNTIQTQFGTGFANVFFSTPTDGNSTIPLQTRLATLLDAAVLASSNDLRDRLVVQIKELSRNDATTLTTAWQSVSKPPQSAAAVLTDEKSNYDIVQESLFSSSVASTNTNMDL